MVRYDGFLNTVPSLNFSRLTHPTRPTKMVRYDGFLNTVPSLNFSRLTHPTGPTHLILCIRLLGRGRVYLVVGDTINLTRNPPLLLHHFRRVSPLQ